MSIAAIGNAGSVSMGIDGGNAVAVTLQNLKNHGLCLGSTKISRTEL
jgi:hypothetical protein